MTLWFMRAIEQDDGKWVCRFGREEFGTFADLESALGQLATAALALGGREVFRFFVHRRDGSIEERLGTDPLPGE